MALPAIAGGLLAAYRAAGGRKGGRGMVRGLISRARTAVAGRPRRRSRRGLTPARLAKIMMLQAVLGKSSPAVKIAGLKLIGGRI